MIDEPPVVDPTYLNARRAVIRAVPGHGAPRAIALFDPGSGDCHAMCGPAIATGAAMLSDFDVLIGMNPRGMLEGLGLDPARWRTVDIRPPVREIPFAPRSRPVPITAEMLFRHTLGLAHRLVTDGQVRHHLASRMSKPFAIGLEDDATVLFLLYRYGALHRRVRVEHRGRERFLPVDWTLPGEPTLDDILAGAKSSGARVAMMFRPPEFGGGPPVPIECCIVDVSEADVTVDAKGKVLAIPRWRIDLAFLIDGRSDQ